MPKIILHKYWIIYFVCISVFHFSCRKKNEIYQKPEIIISSPVENQIFKKHDNIPVSFTVKHYKTIRRIIVYFHDAQKFFFDGSYSFEINSSNCNKSFNFTIKDKNKKQGQYYLLFKIFDDNEEFAYQHAVRVIDNAYKQNGYFYFFTNYSANKSFCYHLDSNFVITKKIEFVGDFYYSGFNKSLQQITICRNRDYLQTLSVTDFSLLWDIKFNNPYTIPYFTYFYSDAENIVVATIFDNILNYRNDGSLRLSSNVSSQQIVRYIDVSSDYWIVLSEDKYGTTNYLNTYFAQTGEIKSSLAFNNQNLKAAFIIDKSLVIVFSIKNNNTHYLFFNPETNTYSEEGEIWQGKANLFCKINEHNYLMIVNKLLLHFDVYHLQKNVLKNNLINAKIFFDSNASQAILKANDSLFFYSFPPLQLQQQIPFMHPILSIHAFFEEQP